MTWEMFTARDDPGIAKPVAPPSAQGYDGARISGEGAITNDRAVRIRVHVEHRSKVEVDSRQRQFNPDSVAGSVGQQAIIRAAH